jgi:3-hydroxyanthranilate 3,4-dioxygenase
MSAFGESNKQLNLVESIEAIRPTMLPPVNNRMIFDDDFKVMAVGGPNERKDFHIEMGAELFYQHQGPMTVVIINPHTGRSDPIRIEEGELFYLPAGIPHSPQRYANTVGIVFERMRHESECDSLRWYTDEDEVLYAEYFHCKDLGSEIKAAILRFRAFLENPTPLPAIPEFANGLLACMENAKNCQLRKPFNLKATLDAAPAQGVTKIVDEEFVMVAVKGCEQSLTVDFPPFMREIYFWQFAGSCLIRMETADGQVVEGEVTTLLAGEIHLMAHKNCPVGVTKVTVTTSNPEDVVLVNYNVTKF